MQMKGTMKLSILGVSRYDFDGIQGARVFAQGETDGKNQNVIGIEVAEFGCEFSIFEGFRGYTFPMDFECETEFRRGAKGKAAPFITAARPVTGNRPAQPQEKKAA